MRTYSVAHLSDPDLLSALTSLIARERITTAKMLAHLAEVDARKLYLPAAHPSMFAWCVEELGLSEDAACKRITAARAARQFPAIFEALATGKLHLSGVVLLAPHLTAANAADLLDAAAGKRKAEIEDLLARRFPRTELMSLVTAIPSPEHQGEPSAPGRISRDVSETAPAPEPRAKVAPLAAERYGVQFMLSQAGHDNLRYAQALLGHQVPSGDIGAIFERALACYVERLERRKFAATPRHRADSPRPSADPRHIPAAVRHAVWERDRGQCTFRSASGRRCAARSRLEFDHIDPVARGGQATVERMRLRCRAHNQYEAEQVFGAGFMERKREAARRARARSAVAARREYAGRRGDPAGHGKPAKGALARRDVPASGQEEARAMEEAHQAEAFRTRAAADEVIPYLRALGFRVDEARRAAALCEAIPDAPLEERVKLALKSFGRPPQRPVMMIPQPPA